VSGWLSPKHLTLDFGAGHDLSFVRSSPGSGSLLRIESACLPPSAPHPHHLSQINKILKEISEDLRIKSPRIYAQKIRNQKYEQRIKGE